MKWPSIPENEVQHLLDFTAKSIGKPLRICYRDEKAPSIYWWLINTFFLLLSKVAPRMKHFVQASGHTIMFPNRANYSDFTDPRVYTVLRHECVHLRDQAKSGPLFLLSYALVGYMRAHWEFRGYAQNLIVAHELGYELTDELLDWVGEHFWGWTYVFMYPFKKRTRAKLHKLRQEILEGKVAGIYPNISFWKY